MTNLMQRGASWLATKLKSANVAGRTVVYHRGPMYSEALQAVCTDKTDEVDEAEGFATGVKLYDWTFARADLLIRGESIEPRNGDTITETLNGEEIEYRVAPPSASQPCFERTDTSGVMITVHTKRVR